MTFLEQLKAAWRPMLAYFGALLLGMLGFMAVIARELGLRGNDAGMLAAILGTSLVGTLLGVSAALARIRGTWVVLAGLLDWAVMTALIATDRVHDDGAMQYVLIALYFLPVALTGGFWSLATGRTLLALWHPVVYFTGAILVWIQRHKGIGDWLAGRKDALWDDISVLMVGAMVASCLVYVAAHEGYRLALWRRGPRAALPTGESDIGDARPRTDLRALVALLLVGALVTGGTALLAPWLWRTGPAKDGNGSGEAPTNEPPPETDGNSWMEQVAEVLVKMVEAAKEAAGALCNALAVLLMVGLLLLATWRPIRRALVLRHLREPFWDMTPTRRVEQAWRAVEIALGDIGIHAQSGEDAMGLARRARPALEKLSPVEVHGLEDAAAIADRVRFGLGVQPDDVATMVRFARWACDTVWERLDDTAQIKAMYRGL